MGAPFNDSLADPFVSDAERAGRAPARRSLYALAAFAAGMMLGRACPGVGSAVWFGTCQAVLVGALLGRGWVCRGALAAGVVLLGAGWFALRVHETPAASLARWLGEGGQGGAVLMTVEGVALEGARPTRMPGGALGAYARRAGGDRVHFPLDVDGVLTDDGRVAAEGVLWVFVEGGGDQPGMEAGEAVGPGERVRITGTVSGVDRPLNPGEPDSRLWAAQDGRVGTMSVPDGSLVRRVEGERRVWETARSVWLRGVSALRGRAERAVGVWDGGAGAPMLGAAGEPDRGRALLGALLLGERRDAALRGVDAAFTRLGLVHVLSISGFHLAVMAAVALFLVRLGGDRAWSGWAEPAMVGVMVLAYMSIVPASAPLARSGVMVLAFLAAEASGRRYDRLTLLGWIALALLMWRPLDLWSIGYQLSFGLVGVLLWLGEGVHARLFGRPLKGTIPRPDATVGGAFLRYASGRAARLASASLLCWAAAAPVVAYHTGLVSPLAAVASVVVVPGVVLILWIGYAALLAGVVVPQAGAPAAWVVGWLGDGLAWLVVSIDELPWMVVRLPRLSAWWTVAATGLILYWFRRGHARDGWAVGGTVLVGAWLAVEVGLGARLGAGTALRIDTLAVGDGTCHLVRGGGEALLWDCGSIRADIGEREIPRAVRALGAWRVPTVVVSHADFDHYSGVLDVVEPLGVRRVLVHRTFVDAAERGYGGAGAGVGGPAALLRGLRERGVEIVVVRAGDVVRVGERGALEFVWPLGGAGEVSAMGRAGVGRDNDASLVARLRVGTEAGERRVLFTGDIGAAPIGALLGAPGPDGVRAEVLELPHHGSAHEAAYEFARVVDPRVVLQSTGVSRAGDARWDAVRAGRSWFTTATDGAAWVEIGRDGAVRSGAFRR